VNKVIVGSEIFGERKMLVEKFKKNFVVGLIVLLVVSSLLVALPSVSSAVTSEIDTFAYMIVTPDPVGVNQQVIVTFGVDKTAPAALIRSGNWEGLEVKITKPDGSVEVRGPYTAYSIGNIFFMYTPTQTGTYTFEGTFPGQWINGSYRTISERGTWSNSTSRPLTEAAWYYKESSAIASLTVQSDPIPYHPGYPLPIDYWTRPLNAEIKNWGQVADNWLMPKYDEPTAWRFSATAFAPYTSAPDSAHILWKQPITDGGVVGGPYGDVTYRTGLSYEPFYSLSIVINGRIIYDVHGPTSTDVYGSRCIDLYTGEEIFYLDGVTIAFAQVLQIDNPNEHGAMAYLWETGGSASNGTWKMYDAFTGQYLLTVTNITGSSGNARFGPNGELLIFTLSGTDANRRLVMWNSTKAIMYGDPTPSSRSRVNSGTEDDYWSPGYRAIVDGSKGIEWNVSLPASSATRIIAINVKENTLITALTDHSVFPFIFGQEAFPVMLEKTAGVYPSSIQARWVQNRSSYTMREGFTNINDGVYAMWDEGLKLFHGYSIESGAEIWTTDPVPEGWGLFTAGNWIAYGKLIAGFYDGYMRAYDVSNGDLAWEYYMGDTPYLENAYGSLPAYGFTIADHKVFVSNDEHSPDSVLWRGGKLWAIDTDTGDLLWSVSGRLRHATVADGILTAYNLYDNQLYTFGKGQSKTTVSAPAIAVPTGTAVMISGTVTDQTPASKDTAAISDESMSAWMEYLHMQKPKPTNATGVSVKLTVVNEAGTATDIGTVISDSNGNFGYSWVPTSEGQYKIVATFEDTNSYYGSEDSAYITISSQSAQPTTSPTSTSPITTTTPSITTSPPTSPTVAPQPDSGIPTETVLIVAAALAIIAVIAVVALLLRKRQ
jgi:hypothetical protein